MATSADRINEILARAREEREAQARNVETNAKAEEQKKEFVNKLEAKWVADTYVVQAAVQEIARKLETENVQIAFQPMPGNPGTTVGRAQFNGRSGHKAPGAMTFNVFETGSVNIYFDQQKASHQFKLLQAEAETFKGVILEFCERLIFP